ncbi:MAG: PRC-barrel domain-containing protein [Longimicrobiales bacterium]|nr:PRC-barrel domain-containing protein [Longimicrobiales bacterium]
MLRSMEELEGYVLEATDGELGRCEDFLFDDQLWIVRYMVADTGKWLPGRKVLISPISLNAPDWESRRFPVGLTRQQIETAPPLDEHEPVSRQYEAELFAHLGYLPYWGSSGIWGPSSVPRRLRTGEVESAAGVRVTIQPKGDPHLRSLDEVTGYRIDARDDEVGHVEDFIVDDEGWTIRYMIVDTRNWLPGRKVIIPPRWVEGFDWKRKIARVDLTREQIENSPEFEPGAPVNRAYETRLYDYYGRPVYWD